MKKIFQITLLIAAFACAVGCQPSNEKFNADQLKVTWQKGENNDQGQSGFVSYFTITNNTKADLTGEGWNIYFNFARTIRPESVSGNVSIRHINGDFFELSPNPEFMLASGDSAKISFVSSDWVINYSEAPAGLYIVTNTDGKENKPQVISNYVIVPFADDQTKRGPADLTPLVTGTTLYTRYASGTAPASDDAQPIIPTPVSYQAGKGTVAITLNFQITADAQLEKEKRFLEATLKDRFASVANASDSPMMIKLIKSAFPHNGKRFTQGSEAYKLEVKQNEISIMGTDDAGVFYGIQSLLALVPVSSYKEKSTKIEIPIATVVDYPRFGYRGIHLDVARNFQKKEAVMKMLDLMAFYKLNKLHFHLSDDEGWRVELESLPELTAIGGYRGHDKTGKGMVPSFGSGPFPAINESYGSGFYTQEDFVEILRYANDRHIEIIPKIDMPGHARAAIKAMDYRYEKLKNQENNIAATQYLLRDLNDSSQYKSVQGWNDNVICVCQQSTYNFISTVVNDFVKLYEKANVPFTTFHIGADEVPHGVWEKSPACKEFFNAQQIPFDGVSEYFFKRVSAILKEKNLNMGGWEEIALRKVKQGNGVAFEANPAFVKENFRPYVWNNVWGWDQEDVGYKLANAGYKTVLGNVTNLYFDLAYEKHPEENGYYWGAFTDTRKVYEFNPFNIYLGAKEDKLNIPLDQAKLNAKVRITEAGKKNILGIQGQLWSENIKGQDVLEYMAFPKLLALAERAWGQEPAWSNIQDDNKRNAAFEKDWAQFATSLGSRELPRLDYLNGGVQYRISPPGAQLKDGKLYASVEFPGLTIRYTTDGSEPTASSPVYEGPVSANGTIKLKAFNTVNRGSRTVIAKAE